MTTPSASPTLTDIGFSWRCHRAALWWLCLLYRRPAVFTNSLHAIERKSLKRIGLLLFFSALYCLILGVIGRLMLRLCLSDNSNLSFTQVTDGWLDYAFFPVLELASLQLLLGFIFLAFSSKYMPNIILLTQIIQASIFSSLSFCIFGDLSIWASLGISFGLFSRISYDIRSRVPQYNYYILSCYITVATISYIFSGDKTYAAFILAYIITLNRSYYIIPHILFLIPGAQSLFYFYHPVSWDDLCDIPFPYLERILGRVCKV
jgi:hypothetical protein